LADWPKPKPKQLWRKPVGAGWCAFAVQGDYAVTMEQDADREWTTSYDVRNGKPLWGKSVKARHENPLGGVGPRSTPTIDGEYVYSLGATGILQCLKLDSGELVWTDDLLKRYYSSIDAGDDDAARLKRQTAAELLVQWGYTSSPLIYENLVIVQGGGPVSNGKFQGKSLIAFDKLTGKVVWEGGDQQIAYVSPVIFKIDERDQVVIVNEAVITGHDPKTGETLWSFPWKGTSNQDANNSQPQLIGPNRIFISKGYFSGSAVFTLLGDESGKYEATEEWQNLRLLKTKFTNVTIINGYAYGLSDGIMECGNLETGKSQWKSRKGNFGHGQVLGVGDRIIVLGEKGELGLIAADPSGYKEIARFQALVGKTWNSICLAGKRLLVRNAEEAVCYELP
jgi:outer membrane protein assembly factor BamB